MSYSHIKPAIIFYSVAGAIAGDIVVTGIETDDELINVADLSAGGDFLSEFTITAADTINNGGGTSTSGKILLVIYKRTGAGHNYGADAGKDY